MVWLYQQILGEVRVESDGVKDGEQVVVQQAKNGDQDYRWKETSHSRSS